MQLWWSWTYDKVVIRQLRLYMGFVYKVPSMEYRSTDPEVYSSLWEVNIELLMLPVTKLLERFASAPCIGFC